MMRGELTPAEEYEAAVIATDRAMAAWFEAVTGRPFVARRLPVAATWDEVAS